jgi:hypothetical protein
MYIEVKTETKTGTTSKSNAKRIGKLWLIDSWQPPKRKGAKKKPPLMYFLFPEGFTCRKGGKLTKRRAAEFATLWNTLAMGDSKTKPSEAQAAKNAIGEIEGFLESPFAKVVPTEAQHLKALAEDPSGFAKGFAYLEANQEEEGAEEEGAEEGEGEEPTPTPTAAALGMDLETMKAILAKISQD